MASFVQQLPALVGVLIGALSTYFVGSAMERSRWERQQSARWDEKRIQAYADYGYALKNEYIACLRVVGYRHGDSRFERIDLDEALTEIRQLSAERTAKWESVLLLGNPQTIAAARTWHEHVWEVELYARGVRSDAARWADLLKEIGIARARFYEAARGDLGIRSGQVAPSVPREVSLTLTNHHDDPEAVGRDRPESDML
jgi:hypothetical protein